MGGHYWKDHGLSTPRMPPAVYQSILLDVKDKLKSVFCRVDHAVTAPEKADYGDIDVLALAKTLTPNIPSADSLALLLDAEKYEHAHGLICFAIPWPKSLVADFQAPGEPEPFAQIDLRICESTQEFNWRLMIQAHGDLISIVSAIIRHKGLTITDDALYVRMSEIETTNRKLSRVELSRDTHRVLSYLGLNAKRFFEPFSTRDEMMNFVATCRFHDPGYVKKEIATQDSDQLTAAAVQTLHKWDQNKFNVRPMFRYWYEEYLPKHTDDRPGRSAHLSRDQTLQDVFQFFGPLVETHYRQQLKYARMQTGRVTFTHDFKTKLHETHPDLPDTELEETAKALKKTMAAAQRGDEVSESQRVQNAWIDGQYKFVIDWAVENHAQILEMYRAKVAQAVAVREGNPSKLNPFSSSPAETYTAADDKIIIDLKEKGRTWPDILRAIKKTSKSQLIAHYKQDLATASPTQ